MLEIIAITSLLFGVGVTTGMALLTAHTGGQKPLHSLVEAWFNIVAGFTINFVANITIFRGIGYDLSNGDAFYIGCIFTSVSVIRSFLFRRLFNSWHQLGDKLAQSDPSEDSLN